MKTKKSKYINHTEQITGFISVLLIFSLFTGIYGFILFTQYNNQSIPSQKANAIQAISKLKEFQELQAMHINTVDSLYNKIKILKHNISPSSQENEIQIMLNDINKIHENHHYDKRYKVFRHIAQFYQMWLNDNKELWCKKQNIDNFNKNLEICEIGLQKELQLTKQ